MKFRSVTPIRIAKVGYILLSAALTLLGIAFFALPQEQASFLGRLLGIVFAVFGAIKLVGYFSRDLFRLAFEYDLQFGALALAVGALILIRSDEILNSLLAVVGLAVLADGLFHLLISRDARIFGIRSWRSILGLSLLCAVIGLLMVLLVPQSAFSLQYLLGAGLIADGCLNGVVAITTVKIVKNQLADHPLSDECG